MKIRAIRLANVGTFARPTAVEGLSGALDVLVGPNEMGKSTLLRALRTLFEEKHTATGRVVDVLRARSGGEPLVEADFEVDGRLWRATKRYGGKGRRAALLDLGGSAIAAEGPDAEEALAALLAKASGAAGGMSLLWADQGAAIDPVPPTELGRQLIDAVIEREVATAAGGGLARRLGDRVTKELDRNVQQKNRQKAKANSDYDRALGHRDDLKRELAVAQAAAAASAERIEKLGLLAERLSAIAGPAAAAERKRLHSAAAQALDNGRLEHLRLKSLRAEFEAQARAAERAAAELRSLDADLQQLANVAGRIEEAKRRHTEVAAKSLAAEQRLAAAEAACAHAAAAEERAIASLALADRRAARMAAEGDLAAVSRQLGAARLIAAEIEATRALLVRSTVSEALVAELEAIDRQLAGHAARRSAVATRVRVQYEPGRPPAIRADGVLVGDGEEVLAAGVLRLEVPGVGRLTITPAASAKFEVAEAEARELAARRSRLLADGGVANLAAAQETLSEHRARQHAVSAAELRLAAVAGGGLAELEARTAFLSELVAASPPGDGPSREECAAALDSARRTAGEARAAKGEAAASEVLQRELAALQAARAAEEAALGEIAARLPPDAVRSEERARRAAAAEATAVAARSLQLSVSALAETAPEADALAALESAARRADAAEADAIAEAGRLREAMATLEGEQRYVDESGLGTRVAAIEGELARAEEAVGRYRREIGELELIATALAKAEADTRARYLTPVVARIAPYLDLLLPEARISFGAGYAPMALVRSGLDEVIGSLSRGTQEQIAILVRLGFGRLLAEGGHPVPLILDDALVYADDQRMQAMFRALALAAQSHQVLLLTCRSAMFADLGGTRLALSPWRPEKT